MATLGLTLAWHQSTVMSSTKVTSERCWGEWTPEKWGDSITLSHMHKKQCNYVRLMFVDYNSVFDTIVPSKLFTKLRNLGLNSHVCTWELNFLTGSSQVVSVGRCVSDSINTNTEAPQGCILSHCYTPSTLGTVWLFMAPTPRWSVLMTL